MRDCLRVEERDVGRQHHPVERADFDQRHHAEVERDAGHQRQPPGRPEQHHEREADFPEQREIRRGRRHPLQVDGQHPRKAMKGVLVHHKVDGGAVAPIRVVQLPQPGVQIDQRDLKTNQAERGNGIGDGCFSGRPRRRGRAPATGQPRVNRPDRPAVCPDEAKQNRLNDGVRA